MTVFEIYYAEDTSTELQKMPENLNKGSGAKTGLTRTVEESLVWMVLEEEVNEVASRMRIGEAREERRLKRPRKYMGTKRDQDCTEPK